MIYGDKVICVRNHVRDDVKPPHQGQEYIANGEMGNVVGEYRPHGQDGADRPSCRI